MIRSLWRGGMREQPDGSAKSREVKLVTVWTAESRAADGLPVRDAGLWARIV